MLSPWLELPGTAEKMASWSTVSGLDLARLGTTASAEDITDTAVTQPLVVAATLLAHQELTGRGVLADDVIVAGHSVGEIAAYAIAGVISADDAVALAASRGAEMAKACANEPTGMSAVLGGDEAEVLARLEQLDLVPANGPLRVFTLLHDARPVLLNLGEPGGFDLTPRAERVQLVDAKYVGTWELPALGRVTPPTALLIRPDGYVAWVGDLTQLGLADALTTWFEPPTAA